MYSSNNIIIYELFRVGPKEAKIALQKTASKILVCAFTELAYNVLFNDEIPIPKRLVPVLRPFKKQLTKLTDILISDRKREQIIRKLPTEILIALAEAAYPYGSKIPSSFTEILEPSNT